MSSQASYCLSSGTPGALSPGEEGTAPLPLVPVGPSSETEAPRKVQVLLCSRSSHSRGARGAPAKSVCSDLSLGKWPWLSALSPPSPSWQGRTVRITQPSCAGRHWCMAGRGRDTVFRVREPLQALLWGNTGAQRPPVCPLVEDNPRQPWAGLSLLSGLGQVTKCHWHWRERLRIRSRAQGMAQIRLSIMGVRSPYRLNTCFQNNFFFKLPLIIQEWGLVFT